MRYCSFRIHGRLFEIDASSPMLSHPRTRPEVNTPNFRSFLLKFSKRPGEIGDSKIFIIPIEDAIRARTGDSGNGAMQNRAIYFLVLSPRLFSLIITKQPEYVEEYYLPVKRLCSISCTWLSLYGLVTIPLNPYFLYSAIIGSVE